MYNNFEQAASGSNRGVGVGRINAWFDHNKPGSSVDIDCSLEPGSGIIQDNQLTNYLAISTESPSNVCECIAGCNCYDGHNGIDFHHALEGDEAVFAAASGTIFDVIDNCQEIKTCGEFGNQVWIVHGNCYAILYGCLDRVDPGIDARSTISGGQQIGIMGNTGFHDDIHLHFGLYRAPTCNGLWNDKIAVAPYGWFSLDLTHVQKIRLRRCGKFLCDTRKQSIRMVALYRTHLKPMFVVEISTNAISGTDTLSGTIKWNCLQHPLLPNQPHLCVQLIVHSYFGFLTGSQRTKTNFQNLSQ